MINGEAPIKVKDDLSYAYFFNVEMILEWSRDLVPFFTIGKLRLNDSKDRNLPLVEQSKEYSMIATWLYKLGEDGILTLCVDAQEAAIDLDHAYIAMGNLHMSPKQTKKRVERMGVYWSTMHKGIYDDMRD